MEAERCSTFHTAATLRAVVDQEPWAAAYVAAPSLPDRPATLAARTRTGCGTTCHQFQVVIAPPPDDIQDYLPGSACAPASTPLAHTTSASVGEPTGNPPISAFGATGPSTGRSGLQQYGLDSHAASRNSRSGGLDSPAGDRRDHPTVSRRIASVSAGGDREQFYDSDLDRPGPFRTHQLRRRVPPERRVERSTYNFEQADNRLAVPASSTSANPGISAAGRARAGCRPTTRCVQRPRTPSTCSMRARRRSR